MRKLLNIINPLGWIGKVNILLLFSCSKVYAAPAGGGTTVATLTDFLSNVQKMTGSIVKIAEVGLTAVGIFFVAKGMFAIKAHHDQPQGQHLTKGIVTIVVGSLCIGAAAITHLLQSGLIGSANWSIPANPGFGDAT
ncbi:MAG: hypothetical protein COB50_00275 [Thiotrichales bacterium]|nr:MAG: hypothetical protein COB50_00275 [Thiotrichales bacterium]